MRLLRSRYTCTIVQYANRRGYLRPRRRSSERTEQAAVDYGNAGGGPVGTSLGALGGRQRACGDAQASPGETEQVRRALAAYAEIPVRFLDVDLEDAMAVADALQIYAYDAYVLACAQVHRAPVISLDRGLVRAAAKLDLDIIAV